MKIVQTAASEVDVSHLTVEICSKCSRSKLNHPQGEIITFKSPVQDAGSDVYRTTEWFGSGGSAHNVVLVSQRFVKLILELKWRGVHLAPVG
jgi:hypothetical protein